MPPRPRGRQGADPDVPRPKNTQKDRDFITAQYGNFRHLDGKLVWSGRSADLGNPYQVAPDEYRCQRTRVMHDDEGGQILGVDRNPLKEQCPAWAMPGADRCVEHAEGSKAVMEKVRERIASDANVYYAQLRADALNPDNSASDRIKAINSLLDRGGLKAGVEISATEDSWAALQKLITGETDDGGS